MKKYFIAWIAFVCLFYSIGIGTAEAAHFDHDEAINIVCENGGWWTDCNTGKKIHFSANNILSKGKTDPSGSSKIFLGSKGAPFIMNVTYYADQNKYYAEILIGNSWDNNVTWKTFMACAYRN